MAELFERVSINGMTLVKRWHNGDHRGSECGSCNSCFAPVGDGRGVYCVTMKKKRGKAGG